MANADCVSDMTRQLTTLYQHAQYWQKNNTYGDTMDCVINYTVTYARKRLKLDSEHWHDHEPKLVEPSHANKVNHVMDSTSEN
jgi:hypothetical protein